jgi:putative serine protease PepD
LVGAELRSFLTTPIVDGLMVEVVEPGSPAEKAGLRGGEIELTIGGDSLLLGGDIVVSLNGKALDTPENLLSIMRGLKVGKKVELKLFRDGKTREVSYVLPERPLLPGDIPDGDVFSDPPRPMPRNMSRPRY